MDPKDSVLMRLYCTVNPVAFQDSENTFSHVAYHNLMKYHTSYPELDGIGVSLYSTPTGTAYIEPLVESQKSTRTAKKGNTVLS